MFSIWFEVASSSFLSRLVRCGERLIASRYISVRVPNGLVHGRPLE